MSKESDVRITPEWLLERVRAFCGGPIPLDVCTEADNPTKALTYFCERGDELPWEFWPAWCNGPYSRGSVERWGNKAIHEARQGCEVLFLTKDDCRTGWNKLLRDNADVRLRIEGSVGFLEPDGKGDYRPMPGASWGTSLWYFGARRRRFVRVFGDLGEVTQLLGPQEVEEP